MGTVDALAIEGEKGKVVYSAFTDLADQSYDCRVRAIECVPPRSRVHSVYTGAIRAFTQSRRSDGISVELGIRCKGSVPPVDPSKDIDTNAMTLSSESGFLM